MSIFFFFLIFHFGERERERPPVECHLYKLAKLPKKTKRKINVCLFVCLIVLAWNANPDMSPGAHYVDQYGTENVNKRKYFFFFRLSWRIFRPCEMFCVRCVVRCVSANVLQLSLLCIVWP